MASSAFPKELKAAAEDVALLLRERGESVSVAETAAGGLISASLLSTPGASKFYKGGLTVESSRIRSQFAWLTYFELYTLPSRVEFAGWTQQDIDKYKGPTPHVVSGLSENVRQKLASTYCVCESGTAGPTGGNTPNRTPGYVALAVTGERGTVSKELDTGLGTDREGNMVSFAVLALKLLQEYIIGEAKI